MFLYRIQNRILFLFVGLVVSIILLSGWLLDWSIRRSLEAELGRKLIAVAQAVSASLDPEEIAVLMEGPGPRTARRLDEKINRFRTKTEVARIYLFDTRERILLDTGVEDQSRPSDVDLLFFKSELEAVWRGNPAHSILFEGVDGRPAMTGFSPVLVDGAVRAGVAVEGSATFLDAARQMRNRLISIAALSIFSAIGLGLFLARTITQPIKRLVTASNRIGRGDYSAPVLEPGKDEIGHLAGTMEIMRRSILERENELKALVAGVAHEIRNPLGGMELFAGLLKDDVKPGTPASKNVEHIAREIGHLKEIVNRFLDFARPQKPVQESCRVRDILQSCLDLIDGPLSNRHIRVENRISDFDTVWVDPNHLKEILLNLVQNSLDALPENGTLILTSRREGPFLVLHIEDTGRGIPEEIRAQIYTPFFTTRPDGTGLGLSIAKSLVEANGGGLHLISSGPDGTKFEIRLLLDET
jgi:signal transduction histidine kinase